MTDNVTNLRQPISCKGPERSGYSVVVDGRVIPRMHMHEHQSGDVELVLDGRFSFVLPKEWAYLAAALAAQALAIGSGYPFIGADTKDRPFAPRYSALPFMPEVVK